MSKYLNMSSIVPFDVAGSVLSCPYVKLLKQFLLWPFGLWPGNTLGEKEPIFIKFHREFVRLVNFFCMISELIFIHTYYKSMTFISQGYTYLVFLLTILTGIRIFIGTSKSYGKIVKTYIDTLHLAHRKLNDGYEKELFNNIEKISYTLAFTITLLAYIGVNFFDIAPMYLNYKNGFFSGQIKENATYNCIACITVPKIIDTHEFTIFGTIFSVYLTYPVAASVCGTDLLLTLIAIQIIGNLLLLRNRLENLAPSQKEMKNKIINKRNNDTCLVSFDKFNEEENKIMHEKLVDCIRHHVMIIEFTENMSNLFGPVLGCNYGFHLPACCLLLLECTASSDAIFRYGPLTSIIFGQLILLSVVFEIVTTVSEKLAKSVYFTPWVRMDTKNRKTVQIMLVRAQRPIRVTGLGLADVGVTTMAQILKATASYYALLRSINK